MRIYSPYTDDQQTWYRGNIHCHSTGSDGEWSPAQVMAYYRDKRYDFAAITDHGVQTDTRDLGAEGFLCIPGQELSRPHMIGLGTQATIPDRLDFAGQIAAIHEAGGLAILAHPAWSGLRIEDIFAQDGMCGIEVFNYICHRLNGKGYALNIWDELLMRDKRLWGVATDDSHFKAPHAGGAEGWVCVAAPALTQEAIIQSLRDGSFYSSCGPQIQRIAVTGESICVECSPVRAIHFIGQAHCGGADHAENGDELLTRAEFKPTPHMKYCRIEITDDLGRRAWSNPIWIESE